MLPFVHRVAVHLIVLHLEGGSVACRGCVLKACVCVQIGQVHIIDSSSLAGIFESKISFGWVSVDVVVKLLKKIPGRGLDAIPDDFISDNLPGHCCAVGRLANGELSLFICTYNFGKFGTQHGEQSRVAFRSHLRGFFWLYEFAVLIATGLFCHMK